MYVKIIVKMVQRIGDNRLYMVNKYGFMPNGNRTWFLYHSQPPFLSVMVRRIYDFYKDRAWLKGAYECLKTEYDFRMTRRSSPVGLSAGIYLSAKEYIKNADKGENDERKNYTIW